MVFILKIGINVQYILRKTERNVSYFRQQKTAVCQTGWTIAAFLCKNMLRCFKGC